MSMDVPSSLSVSQIVAKIADTVTTCTLLFMESAAQLSLGQTLLRFADRFLWIVEKSVQWSLPTQAITAEENGKSFGKIELVRPLPWIFFLPGLILLRVLRFGLNIGSLILDYPRIEPAAMVKFLQKVRRRLRTIKSNGMKNMRQRKICAKDNNSNMNHAEWRSAQLIRTIQMTLSSLSCLDASKSSPSPPPTRIKVHMNHESTPTPDEQSTTESAISPTHEELKRKYSELSSDEHLSEDSEEETVQAKMDRLAAQSGMDADDDYIPGDLSSLEDDSSSTSGESNISTTEIQDIRDEANLILHRALAGATEIIEEEPEPIKRFSINKSADEDAKFVISKNDCTAGNNGIEFYSPCQLGEDGETAFYSPISSTSPSPDRMIFKQAEQQDGPTSEGTMRATVLCENGEKNEKSEPQIAGSSTDKTTNDHSDDKRSVPTNVSTKNMRSNYRGRRANHASRKKK